jgi:hypothetical protein
MTGQTHFDLPGEQLMELGRPLGQIFSGDEKEDPQENEEERQPG